jgi:hypothetical protein
MDSFDSSRFKSIQVDSSRLIIRFEEIQFDDILRGDGIRVWQACVVIINSHVATHYPVVPSGVLSILPVFVPASICGI